MLIHKQTHNQLIPTEQNHKKNNVTHPVTTFEQAKQIIMDIDALLHSPTLHNKNLQELNLNGLCNYDNTHKIYLFKKSKKIVNCSYILVFLKQSICYAIIPEPHQWYRINTNEINHNHKITLSNDLTVHMVLLPSTEPSEINAFETIARLTFSHTQRDHPNNNCTQPIYSNPTLRNNNTNSSLQDNKVHPHDQSTVILQQF